MIALVQFEQIFILETSKIILIVLDRGKVARWIIEKLLASYVISLFIIYGPLIGLNLEQRGLGTTYTVITSITILISLVSNILIPRDFGVKRLYNRVKDKVNNNEAEQE